LRVRIIQISEIRMILILDGYDFLFTNLVEVSVQRRKVQAVALSGRDEVLDRGMASDELTNSLSFRGQNFC
jgi:hypothetical protein